MLLCKGRDVLTRGSLHHVSSDSIGAKPGCALTDPDCLTPARARILPGEWDDDIVRQYLSVLLIQSLPDHVGFDLFKKHWEDTTAMSIYGGSRRRRCA